MKFLNTDRWIAEHAPGVILAMALLHAPVAGFAIWYSRAAGADVARGIRTSPAAAPLVIAIFTLGLFLIFSGMLSILRARDSARAIRAGNERVRWVSPLVTMASLILLTLVLMAAVMVDTFLPAERFSPKADVTTWLVVSAGVCALIATGLYVLGVLARREKIGPPLLADLLGTVALVGSLGCLAAVGVLKLLGKG